MKKICAIMILTGAFVVPIAIRELPENWFLIPLAVYIFYLGWYSDEIYQMLLRSKK